ncbi:hypothetical protein AMECASPLE_036580 [Ameca splendens]|uniref:Uncharacterized protein n=1 Tax=Ameca splendens TaxID=208324 RepID=A0ABV0Y7I8_9TELE
MRFCIPSKACSDHIVLYCLANLVLCDNTLGFLSSCSLYNAHTSMETIPHRSSHESLFHSYSCSSTTEQLQDCTERTKVLHSTLSASLSHCGKDLSPPKSLNHPPSVSQPQILSAPISISSWSLSNLYPLLPQ